jgi:lipopolysaccharide transport system permease protein
MLTIEANQVHKAYFSNLFQYRELLYFFAWRDLLVRYKQAVFGVLWALIRPLLNMMIFAFLFGKLAHLPSEQINYSLFVLAGMVPWQLFSYSVGEGCLCLLNNAQLVTKIYFPKIIIPTAQIFVHLVDFSISALLLFFLTLMMGSLDFWSLLFFPFAMFLVIMLTLGTNLWLSALTVRYRDVRFLVPFFVQFGMFVSPVGYGTFIIQGQWKWLYYLNPMVGIIDAFRWVYFGISHPDVMFTVLFAAIVSLLILVSGFMYFRNVERFFADQI